MIVTIGYIASAILALSLLVNNAIKFRWLNLAGCFTFIIYGFLIQAIPVIVANSILLVINFVQIIKLYSVKEVFQLTSVSANDELITKFLTFYRSDIEKYFPGFLFKAAPNESQISFVVLRDLAIANIFVARLSENGIANVDINYTVPKYRDYKVGRFIFEKEKEYLVKKGIKKILYEKMVNKNHERFITVMGFTEEQVGDKKCWKKDLI